MAYRLWNDEVAEGITDFNDDHYHLRLFDRTKFDELVVLLFDSEFDEFLLGHSAVIHDVMNAIECEEDDTFRDVREAIEAYDSMLHCLNNLDQVTKG